MIKDELKINNSKTEFFILTFSLFKQQFNDLQIEVVNRQIDPSAFASNY